MSEIAKVHTPCKNCVFAVYDNNTQTDCSLHYIEKFKHNNIEILEAYDNQKEFYIINNKQCIGYTKKSWLIKHNLLDAPITEIVTKYQQYNKLNYVAVINTKGLSLDNVVKVLDNIKKLNIKPAKVVLVRYPDPNNKLEYSTLKSFLDNLHIEWKLQSSVDIDTPFYVFVDNIATIETKYRFVLGVVEPTNEMNSIINKANQIVHDDMGQFMLLKNSENTCIVFSSMVYRYNRFMGGNLLQDNNQHQII